LIANSHSYSHSLFILQSNSAKAQKAIYSKLIYDEIRDMNPPGRFLKQDPKTKLWSDIGEKKALDKTRQALREGAPELLKELGGDDKEGGEDVGPLLSQRQMHHANPLANSLMGNLSLGSFSLGSVGGNDPSLEQLYASANNHGGGGVPPLPSQIGVANNNNMFGSSGVNANAILAAAAQIQLQQQQINRQQQLNQQMNNNQGLTDAQLQLLMNHSQFASNQANQQDTSSFGQSNGQFGGGNNNYNFGQNVGGKKNTNMNNNGMDNMQHLNNLTALLSNQGSHQNVPTPQFSNSNVNFVSDEVAALLAAVHNSASNFNSGGSDRSRGGGSNGTSFQQPQQLLSQMANMNNGSISNGSHNTNFGNVNQGSNVGNIPQSLPSSHHGGYQEESFNVSVPLKSPQGYNEEEITTSIPLKGEGGSFGINGNPSISNRRGGSGLNSSFTRAQRIGLKNSFTRRPNSHRNLTMDVANSLMSIESLTLDDIETEDANNVAGGHCKSIKKNDSLANMSLSGLSNVFDQSEEAGMKVKRELKKRQHPEEEEEEDATNEPGAKVHGSGPYDMSEVSELGFDCGREGVTEQI
jgi:hypothetical protein